MSVAEEPAPAPAHASLEEALLAAVEDAQEIELRRTATGQVGGKKAAARYYKYMDYPELLKAVRPILARHGLLWQTFPTTSANGDGSLRPAMRYVLTHAPTKEKQSDTMLLMLDQQTSQAQGSALTYARRYALQSVLELAPDSDDDGAAASAPASRPAPVDPDEELAENVVQAMFEAIAERGLDRAKVLERAGATPGVVLCQQHAVEVKRILDAIDAQRAERAQEGASS